MKPIYTLIFALGALAQSVPLVQAQPRGKDAPPNLAADVKEIFRMHCFECHGGSRKAGKLAIFDYAHMLKKEIVVPGKLDDSQIIQRITASDGSEMPPKGQPKLNPDEIEKIKQWVSTGAPNFPEDAARPVLDKKDNEDVFKKVAGVEYVLRKILEDVRKTPLEDRRYRRYFSINHILTAPNGTTANALEVQRQALAKAINHLSWQPNLVQLTPIDEVGTVFAIDLRRLGWELQPYEIYSWDGRYKTGKYSRVDLFDIALLDYPYGIVYEGSPTFDYLLNEFIVPSGMVRPIPYVRADWFVSTVTLAPFYEDFLQLPMEIKYLEDKLRVDSYANIKNYVARRAGMAVSGVSRNNRVVERHPSQFGAYWKSFDFKSNKGFENIFRDPVHFDFAGGEMVFHLPNGLQGYYVTNNRGLRIEEAPVEIVTDKFASDYTVRPGLGCMRCHVQGIVGFEDNVLDTLKRLPDQYNYFDKFFAMRLYPEKVEMNKYIDQDTSRFVGAMTSLFGKPWKQNVSPLTPVTQQYLDYPLHLLKAAGELGLADQGYIESLVRTRSFSHFGLSPLAVPGGVVRRDTWEDYFDEVVKEMGLGIPVVPLDGVVRRDFPVVNEFLKIDLKATNVKTKKKTNFYQPGDELFFTATNHTQKPVWVELIATSVRGRKVLLTQRPIQVGAGQTYRYPPTGSLKVGGQTGKEQITLFASYYDFPAGQLLRGKEYYTSSYGGSDYYVSDRVIHPMYYYQKDGNRWRRSLDGSDLVKRTIDIETK